MGALAWLLFSANGYKARRERRYGKGVSRNDPPLFAQLDAVYLDMPYGQELPVIWPVALA